MGYKEYEVRLPVEANEADMTARIAKLSGLPKGQFSYEIVNKSLDARRKGSIMWQYRIGISSPRIREGQRPEPPKLEEPQTGKNRKVAVVGSGPAGIFAAAFLVRAGFRVTVLERGNKVEERQKAISAFEAGGPFPASGNYCFGEGGAGTFSDGKLTSRAKGISATRQYIFSDFIASGAPEEIGYMLHPHLGSDNLFSMTRRMRERLEAVGVEFLFDTMARSIKIEGQRVSLLESDGGPIEADYYVFACGHSANETFRMLMSAGVPFQPKNFALGFRAEHEQKSINQAQWGRPSLFGVKAAEYRLTAEASDGRGVYSFCMCPGGTVVPASAYPGFSVVNGKSDYARDGRFANAAVVAALDLEAMVGRKMTALEALDWLEELERGFFAFTGSYAIPASTIQDFLAGRSGSQLLPSSYNLGLKSADFRELLPPSLIQPLKDGLASFAAKLKGYEGGQIMGLESKTSAPIQVLRHPELWYSRYENLFVAGEGSGWSGGIVSSASDGIKIAQAICRAGAP